MLHLNYCSHGNQTFLPSDLKKGNVSISPMLRSVHFQKGKALGDLREKFLCQGLEMSRPRWRVHLLLVLLCFVIFFLFRIISWSFSRPGCSPRPSTALQPCA